MSENRNWSSTGEQIKGALSEALQTGNFKNLNELVSQTVSDAVSEVGKHVSLGGINIQRKERSDSEPFRDDGLAEEGPGKSKAEADKTAGGIAEAGPAQKPSGD